MQTDQRYVRKRDLIAVGQIVKPFGIRGEVVVRPMTENIERFTKLRRVYVGADDRTATETDVTGVFLDRTRSGVRMRLAGYTTRSNASALVGWLLFVDEREAIRPPAGAYFIHDLIGLRVVDEQGTTLGVVKDVVKYPAQDVYVLDCSGRDVLVPAVKEFIKHIDLAGGTMTVRLIEGMVNEPESVPEEGKNDDAD